VRYYYKCKNFFVQRTPYLVRSESNLQFLDKFSKRAQISNLIKIRPVEAELFHADGHDEAVTFQNLQICLNVTENKVPRKIFESNKDELHRQHRIIKTPLHDLQSHLKQDAAVS
jgi:hypothetical protein